MGDTHHFYREFLSLKGFTIQSYQIVADLLKGIKFPAWDGISSTLTGMSSQNTPRLRRLGGRHSVWAGDIQVRKGLQALA